MCNQRGLLIHIRWNICVCWRLLTCLWCVCWTFQVVWKWQKHAIFSVNCASTPFFIPRISVDDSFKCKQKVDFIEFGQIRFYIAFSPNWNTKLNINGCRTTNRSCFEKHAKIVSVYFFGTWIEMFIAQQISMRHATFRKRFFPIFRFTTAIEEAKPKSWVWLTSLSKIFKILQKMFRIQGIVLNTTKQIIRNNWAERTMFQSEIFEINSFRPL